MVAVTVQVLPNVQVVPLTVVELLASTMLGIVPAPATVPVKVGDAMDGDVAKTILPDPVVELPNAVTVPDVGNVTFVDPVIVNVLGKAPLSV